MKTVIGVMLGLVLAAGPGFSQDPAGGAPKGEKAPGPGEELDKAVAKAGTMTNYSCVISVKVEGISVDTKDSQPVELQIQPGAPWHLKWGDKEAYKKGEVIVVKEGDAWKRPDRAAKGAQSLAMLRGPHEVLGDLKSSSFKEVKREDSEGGRCFAGELTEEAAKNLAQMKRGAAAGDRSLPKPTGTAKVWVNGEGAVTKYEVFIEAKMKGADNQDVTVKRAIAVEFRDIESTKYEVPPEAAKALEG
ncbi:MAG TPA: hypothetical protein VFC90_09285 [Planctomycetota bacterium]|nr:hypothetical protein [Planctomycetota bacterium]